MHKIKIYQDENCSILLSSIVKDYDIYDVDDDLNDGEDEWREFLDEIENMYPDNWAAAVIFSDDGRGRTFYRRREYLEQYAAQVNWLFVPKLFVFGGEGPDSLLGTFPGSLIYELDIGSIDPGNSHIIGRDEYLLSRIDRFLRKNGEAYSKVCVVTNPQEQHIMWLKLRANFSRIVKIDSKKSVNELDKIIQADRIIGSILYDSAGNCSIIDNYKIGHLDFVTEFYEKVYAEQGLSWQRFENAFC